jgi:hypothetical protein
MLVHEGLETIIGVDVFLDSGDLVAGDVVGDVAAVATVLEVVVGLAVGTGPDDGEVAAFHAGDGGQLPDALRDDVGHHGNESMSLHTPHKKMRRSEKFKLLEQICPAPPIHEIPRTRLTIPRSFCYPGSVDSTNSSSRKPPNPLPP